MWLAAPIKSPHNKELTYISYNFKLNQLIFINIIKLGVYF